MGESSEARDVLLNNWPTSSPLASGMRSGPIEDFCDRHPELANDIRSAVPRPGRVERVKADAGVELAVDVADTPAISQARRLPLASPGGAGRDGRGVRG